MPPIWRLQFNFENLFVEKTSTMVSENVALIELIEESQALSVSWVEKPALTMSI